MEYKLIALDMDGTALNDKKQMDKRTREAIHRALAAGKEVVFCTGRSCSEMRDPLREFPDMHYLCAESGALIYDLPNQKPLRLTSISKEARRRILDTAGDADVMLHAFTEGNCYLASAQFHRMADYQMGVYQESFNRVCGAADDIRRLIMESESIEKLNLYHPSPECREQMYARFLKNHLETLVTVSYAETASLECTPLGINKGTGIRMLCEFLGISPAQTIMVGDADNDLDGIRAAGLGVAMGNANDHVKEEADVQVADNNHDGCAEAIEMYLLRA